MNTAEMVSLIRDKKLKRGAYTVNIKPGPYADIMGTTVLVYTDGKPDADLLAFNKGEFLLVVQAAKELTLESFRMVLLAKKMFNGEILPERG